MPGQTRPNYKAGVSAAIFTNTLKLIKGNTVRDKLLVLADSVLFFSEANVPEGYMSIDALGSVDVSFIKSNSPSGKFLRDDGTWQVVSSGSSLPSQTGNSGKYLTTDGSLASWVSLTGFEVSTNKATSFIIVDDVLYPTVKAVNDQLFLKSNLLSPNFTGTPTAPTASIGTDTTQIATTAFVRSEVTALIASAPSALDTLNELAAALGNDANFATTVTNSLATKAPISSPSFTGTLTAQKTTVGSAGLFVNNSYNLGGKAPIVVNSSNSTSGSGLGLGYDDTNPCIWYAVSGIYIEGRGTAGSSSYGVFVTGAGLTVSGRSAFGYSLANLTALVTIGEGTTSLPPLKFISGSLSSTAQVGAFEFLTDKFYGTITTGASRKEFTLNDSSLTSNTMPVTTTNGRLKDSLISQDVDNTIRINAPVLANTALNVGGSGKVNYGSYYLSGSFFTYQSFSNWDAYGSHSPGGTILSIGGFRSSQWSGVSLHTSGSERLRIDSAGNIGVGLTAPTALMHFKSGTTSSSSAPIKLTSGSLMTTPEVGALEFLSNRLYFTKTTGPTRETIAYLSDVLPGGSDTHIQFNSSGVFSGSSSLVWDNGARELKVNGYSFLGDTRSPTAVLDLAASVASKGSLRIRAGTQPTTGLDGLIYYDGTDLWIYTSSTWRQFQLL